MEILEEMNDERIVFTEKEVNNALMKINTRKASGPDGVSGKVLKECRVQLSPVLLKLYQESMDKHDIPIIWLTAELVPVPKSNLPKEKNDLRPIALTAIIMKCFERIVLKHLDPNRLVDKSQFAYITERSVEDATLTLTHHIQEHLDKKRTYARVLFIDFSSAFNTIQPHLMLQKLMKMNVNANLIMWINSFLTGRRQYVRFKGALSDTIIISTGGPQGCVLSAGLFILYSSDKHATQSKCFILKYADDTVIVGLLDDDDAKDDDEQFRNEIQSFVQWCEENYLILNVKKTKEVVIDFRVNKLPVNHVIINGEEVGRVENYKYLGTIIDAKLNGVENVTKIVKKANKRMYFVRKLRKVNVGKNILTMFYRSTVESVITFCMLSWYGNCPSYILKKLKKIIKVAKRLGCNAASLDELYEELITKKVKRVMKLKSHPLCQYFKQLPSASRLSHVYARLDRYRNSFVPSGIRAFNKKCY